MHSSPTKRLSGNNLLAHVDGSELVGVIHTSFAHLRVKKLIDGVTSTVFVFAIVLLLQFVFLFALNLRISIPLFLKQNSAIW